MWPIKVSESISIRPMKVEDAEEVYNTIVKNREHLLKWFEWPDIYKSVDDAKAFLENFSYENPYEHYGLGIWENERYIGSVALLRGSEQNKHSEVGYWLAESHMGRGIMTRAVLALLKVVFNDFGMHKVNIKCVVYNLKSIAVPERLNFEFEGIERDAVLVRGKYYDVRSYSILDHEFQNFFG